MAVRYISSFSVGTLHGMINRSLLSMLCRLYPGEVECHVTASTVEMLRDAVPDGAVKRWRRLWVNSGKGKSMLLLRYVSSAFYNLMILFGSRRDDVLFYNFNNVMSLWLLDFFNRALKRDIVVCCHGEMEYLANASKHKKSYKKLMSGLTCRFFNRKRRRVSPGLRFIVFGDVIKENLRPYISDTLYDRLHSMDHPVQPLGDVAGQPDPHDGIDIGTVGIMNSYKGSDDYPEVASRFSDRDDLRFHVVGHVQCDSEPLTRAGIVIPENHDRPVSDEEFARRVANLDYILFLYPSDNYRLIASGALLDAVRFRRPLVGIGTDYFRYIFDKFGKFGYLAADKEELVAMIGRLDKNDGGFDFDEIARRLSPEALLPDLKAAMDARAGK